MGEAVDPDVAERVRRDFGPDDQQTVLQQLASMRESVPTGNLSSAQMAVLELAKSDPAEVTQLVTAARRDFRDVVYWAYAYDRDPYRLLCELCDSLIESGSLSDAERTLIVRAGGITNYSASLEALCTQLAEGTRPISEPQYQAIRQLGVRLRSKAIWKPLRRNVV